jgi:hypothetical protein
MLGQARLQGHHPFDFRHVEKPNAPTLGSRLTSLGPYAGHGRHCCASRHRQNEHSFAAEVAAIADEIADVDSPTEETDRTAALLSLCDMDATELQIYTKMLEVYDKARSHFLFEIVELQVKRYLNAERLKAEAEPQPRISLCRV